MNNFPEKMKSILAKPNVHDWQHDSRSNLWTVTIKNNGKTKVIVGVGETFLTVKLND